MMPISKHLTAVLAMLVASSAMTMAAPIAAQDSGSTSVNDFRLDPENAPAKPAGPVDPNRPDTTTPRTGTTITQPTTQPRTQPQTQTQPAPTTTAPATQQRSRPAPSTTTRAAPQPTQRQMTPAQQRAAFEALSPAEQERVRQRILEQMTPEQRAELRRRQEAAARQAAAEGQTAPNGEQPSDFEAGEYADDSLIGELFDGQGEVKADESAIPQEEPKAASSEETNTGTPDWVRYLAIALGLLVVGGIAYFAMRRRKPKIAAQPPAEDAESEPLDTLQLTGMDVEPMADAGDDTANTAEQPAPPKAPTVPSGTVGIPIRRPTPPPAAAPAIPKSRAPSGTVSIPASRIAPAAAATPATPPKIDFEFIPEVIDFDESQGTTLRFVCNVANHGGTDIHKCAFRVAMLSAGEGADRSASEWMANPTGPVSTEIETINAGHAMRLSGEMVLTPDRVRPLSVGGKPMMVPMVLLSLHYETDDEDEGHATEALIVGGKVGTNGSGRLTPLPIGALPGPIQQLGARRAELEAA